MGNGLIWCSCSCEFRLLFVTLFFYTFVVFVWLVLVWFPGASLVLGRGVCVCVCVIVGVLRDCCWIVGLCLVVGLPEFCGGVSECGWV